MVLYLGLGMVLTTEKVNGEVASIPRDPEMDNGFDSSAHSAFVDSFVGSDKGVADSGVSKGNKGN